MGFGCPICSEKLDTPPAEAQSRGVAEQELNISATPCGHIFHAYCIQKWLSGNLASSKQCPCCRKDVPKLRCLSLYPTSYEETILDDSISDVNGPRVVTCNHGEVIGSLKRQVQRLEDELKEKGDLYKLLSDDYDSINTKYRSEINQKDAWMMKAKQLESYQDMAEEFKEKATVLERQIKQYGQIENMIKGVSQDVVDDIACYPPTQASIKALVEMKSVISREHRSMSKKLGDAKQVQDQLRSDNMKLSNQLQKLQRDYKELSQVFESTRQTSPVAGPSSRLNETITPQQFRLGLSKRRLQHDPLPSTSQSVQSPGVDSDVDVFPSVIKIKKPKVTSVQTAKQNTSTKTSVFQPPKQIGASRGIVLNKFKFVKPAPELVNLSGDSSDNEIFMASDDDNEDDFRIRGSVPGAPFPVPSRRLKSLQAKAENKVLGVRKRI